MRITRVYYDKGEAIWYMDVDALDSGNGISGVVISDTSAKELINEFGLKLHATETVNYWNL